MAGTVETAAAPFWRLVRHYCPTARIAVVRRPVREALESMLRLGLGLDERLLLAQLRRLDRKLDQIEHRVPGALSVTYDELQTEQGCARLFEHCLPFAHDPAWWRLLAPLNLQRNVAAQMFYMRAYSAQIAKAVSAARYRSLSLMQPAQHNAGDGITFQCEPFEAHLEAKALFAEHLIQTDQSPDDWARKNLPLLKRLYDIGALQIMTARSNGRMFGYLLSVVSPSLDSPRVTEAQHTIFFADPSIRNLGMRLQRAANGALREKGVDQIHMRTGNRGVGPRLGAFYRRLGAEEIGTLYRLGETA
jgi:hypothetical protein